MGHGQSATDTGSITAQIEFLGDRRPDRVRLRLRHPDKAVLRSVTVNGVMWRDFDATRESIHIPDPAARQFHVVARY